MTLMDAKTGDRLIITKIKDGRSRRRLLDFGFTKGAEITVCNIAPFGGTVLISIRGYVLALREFAGNLIEVTCASENTDRAKEVQHG